MEYMKKIKEKQDEIRRQHTAKREKRLRYAKSSESISTVGTRYSNYFTPVAAQRFWGPNV